MVPSMLWWVSSFYACILNAHAQFLHIHWPRSCNTDTTVHELRLVTDMPQCSEFFTDKLLYSIMWNYFWYIYSCAATALHLNNYTMYLHAHSLRARSDHLRPGQVPLCASTVHHAPPPPPQPQLRIVTATPQRVSALLGFSFSCCCCV